MKKKLEEKEECTCEETCACEENCTCENENIDEEVERTEFLGTRIKELENKLLLNTAELQNYKKRTDAEVERMLKYKDEALLTEMLPVIDNLERAIKMDNKVLEDEVSKFLEGFKMIYASLLETLKKFGVEKMNCHMTKFNPNLHQAVMTGDDKEIEDDIITEVYQEGYTYKDRVLRPAMVKVNKI